MPSARFASVRWTSGRDIVIGRDGRHEPCFSERFPLMITGYVFDANYFVTPNAHDYLELSYVVDGPGRFAIGNKSYHVERGDLFVIGNAELHCLEVSPRRPLRLVCLYCLPELVYRPGGNPLDFEYVRPFYLQGDTFDNRVRGGEAANAVAAQRLDDIARITGERGRHYELEVKNRLCEILAALAHHYADRIEARSPAHNRHLELLSRLRPALSLIQASYHGALALDEVANAAHMTRSYFCRAFKRATGCTFSEYVLRVRVDKAKMLLLENEKSVSEILLDVGFGSFSYFFREFKRLTGTTPKEFRRSYGVEKVAD